MKEDTINKLQKIIDIIEEASYELCILKNTVTLDSEKHIKSEFYESEFTLTMVADDLRNLIEENK